MEIVDLGDGEIVLQRADDDSAPLLTIHFSDEANAHLMENYLEVAKAMIQAGIQTAAQLSEVAGVEMDGNEDEATSSADRTLH
ncbi:conserved hypothetical protein [Luminiphilus syltensis NOR5-1B]|uniref:Uncharacterized protein n=1 Tax=Luminiphilus syltensis NOR5-1B TaxID=565045 RepID=B8KYH6_9GAMM|nr:conserved hypothetical protein [Luminiphilus syltensis NOR5-1B]